jgi:predicted tellurium resistance membrane protein TerC
MADLLTFENLGNLGVLIFLQAVLGFDNLLYISIESQRAPTELQPKVRRWGILIALVLRVVLLLVVLQLVDAFEEPFFTIETYILHGAFNFSTLVFLLGGAFIMYTAVKEISHLLAVEDVSGAGPRAPKNAAKVVAMIVLMNLIFSFDSILSALAITKVVVVLTLAIVISATLMLVMADTVSDFLKKNRQYEVLGLFILLIVGVVLLGEGGHEAHMQLFGYAVEPMSKATFYFAMAVLVIVDVLQSKYQKRLAARRASGKAATDS